MPKRSKTLSLTYLVKCKNIIRRNYTSVFFVYTEWSESQRTITWSSWKARNPFCCTITYRLTNQFYVRFETSEVFASAYLRRERFGCVIKMFCAPNTAHLENGVFHPAYPGSQVSKHAKLAFECSKPESQTDCLPGQKWRCEREGRRWRRHKCRNAFSSEEILPIVPPQKATSKKCACFTPNGVIYTRLDTNDFGGHRFTFGKVGEPYGDISEFSPKRGKRSLLLYRIMTKK